MRVRFELCSVVPFPKAIASRVARSIGRSGPVAGYRAGIVALSLLVPPSSVAGGEDLVLRPEWAKDLVIYEIATRGFTSPDGPESGTFRAVTEKLPYLEELGINAIWLSGHSLADPKHFYGIWTQYACIDPGKLDPLLGTEEDFLEMIDEGHRRGIRFLLDTIEHGVMSDSPLIDEHPGWFKGGSSGMTDYDWDGDHPDLDEWWVEMWTNAVFDWGVDGFRCDSGLHRPDLWLEIKRRCAEAGKPIFVLGESEAETISDAYRRDIMLFNQRRGLLTSHAVLTDLASVRDLFYGTLEESDFSFDCGGEGFPVEKNPYMVQGSRAVFGYGVLFAPAIPIFMSGEEFDADYRPLPGHTPDLYGKGEPGTGTWLYASWLQWDQLMEKKHLDMFDDVKRMLAIRREHSDLIHAVDPGEAKIELTGVPVRSEEEIPVPYVLSNGRRALLVAGNPTDRMVEIELNLTAGILGLPEETGIFEATVLWPEERAPRPMTDEDLSRYRFKIPADRGRGGGLHVVRFVPG